MEPHMTSYTVIVERDENGWFIGRVPELPGCHTQGRTQQQLLERMKEAIRAYLAAGVAQQGVRFVGVERVEVPA